MCVVGGGGGGGGGGGAICVADVSGGQREKFSIQIGQTQIGLTPGNRAFHIASLVVGSREYLLLLPRLRGWMGQTGWSGGVGGRAERPVWLGFL